VIETTGAGGGATVKLIVAVVVIDGAPWQVAVRMTVCALLIVAGAVYRPLADIVPTAGVSVHHAFGLLDPVTIAVNC
jgi:hypothetical protein